MPLAEPCPPQPLLRGLRDPEGPGTQGLLESPRSHCPQRPGRGHHHGEAPLRRLFLWDTNDVCGLWGSLLCSETLG